MKQLSQPKHKLFRWIVVAGVPTFLTAIGMFGSYYAAHFSGEGSLADKTDFWLLLPGYFVAISVSALFLSGGGHSAGRLFWLAPPVSWVFYFLICSLPYLFRRKNRTTGKVERPPESVGD